MFLIELLFSLLRVIVSKLLLKGFNYDKPLVKQIIGMHEESYAS